MRYNLRTVISPEKSLMVNGFITRKTLSEILFVDDVRQLVETVMRIVLIYLPVALRLSLYHNHVSQISISASSGRADWWPLIMGRGGEWLTEEAVDRSKRGPGAKRFSRSFIWIYQQQADIQHWIRAKSHYWRRCWMISKVSRYCASSPHIRTKLKKDYC